MIHYTPTLSRTVLMSLMLTQAFQILLGFKVCRATPWCTPRLSSVPNKNNSWSPPPENYAHYSLFAVKPVRPHAEHLESAVTALGNAFHVCLSLSWHKRQCRLDTEAESNNSSASCLHSWSMFMVWEFLVRVPRFVPHYYYFFLLLSPESEDQFLSVRGNTSLCSCLIAALFAPLVIFCACCIL